MNTLFSIFQEFIDLVFFKNVADFLNVDELTFRDYIFLFFAKNTFRIIKNKSIKYLLDTLLYLDFLKYHRKLFSKDFYLIQNCSLVTFFTKSISFFLEFENENQFVFKEKLNEPFRKIIEGILLERKIKQLNTGIQFWRNQNQNLLTFDILNQSYQEILRKKLIRIENDINLSQVYSANQSKFNIFVKRFGCLFPVLFGQEISTIKGNPRRMNNKTNSKSIYNMFLFRLERFFLKKYCKTRIDILNFYFFKEIYCLKKEDSNFSKFLFKHSKISTIKPKLDFQEFS